MDDSRIGTKRGIGILCIFFLLYLGLYQFLILPYMYYKFGFEGERIANTVCYGLMVFSMLFLSYPWIERQLQTWKENWQANLIETLFCMGSMYLSAILFAVIASLLPLTEAGNQSNNLAYFAEDPYGFMFSTVFYAPFVEEIVFRGVIRQFIKEKWGSAAGLLISSFLFGLAHVIADLLSGNWWNMVYILLYGIYGFWIGYGDEKSDTVCTGIVTHMCHNLLGTILIFMEG